MRFDPKSWAKFEKFAQVDPPPEDPHMGPPEGPEALWDLLFGEDDGMLENRVENLAAEHPDKAEQISGVMQHYFDAQHEVNQTFVQHLHDLLNDGPAKTAQMDDMSDGEDEWQDMSNDPSLESAYARQYGGQLWMLRHEGATYTVESRYRYVDAWMNDETCIVEPVEFVPAGVPLDPWNPLPPELQQAQDQLVAQVKSEVERMTR